jgi:alpha-glucosidase
MAIGLILCSLDESIVAAMTNAPSGWVSLTAMSQPQWNGQVLFFHGQQGTLAITPVSDDVIRVRFTRAQSFGRDHSYAIVSNSVVGAKVKVSSDFDSTTLQTATLKVTIQNDPLRISFANAAGEIVDADDADRGIAFAGTQFRVAKQLRDDDHVYGFGEKSGRLDKRGWQLGGYNYVMWNTDTYKHDASTDPMYVSVPFYLVMRHGQAHGLFLDNTWRSSFDVGREEPGLLTFGAVNGELNYYFINGPDPKQVIERYTALTGRIPLPPLWSLGFNQCRYSYYPEARVREIAATFRHKKIPADVIWLDIHYQEGYKPFTWDNERFPDPKKMISDLRVQGFHTVCIVDAHPKKEKGYGPYDQGLAGDFLVKNPDGSVYEGNVWPARAERDPGPSVFPDFSKPAARFWWGSLYGRLLDFGINGIWNDMNEPAVFDSVRGTMPPGVVFDNEGQPSTQLELHNVYGQLMSRASFEGLSRIRPTERPFVLTRASFAGGQRYAAVWTGDNTSDWSSMRQSLSTLLGMGLSGFAFAGVDIGGYSGMPSAELYTRWLQLGVFAPFMRSHSEIGWPNKEPWVFGNKYEEINRHTIELRYVLLPYVYNNMQLASESGLPALRPLFLNYPDDENVAGMDDEFTFGPDLLVAPVLQEGETNRLVYLPKGDWYDYWTGRWFAGAQSISVPVSPNSIPMYVRGGGFIFRQAVVQNTDEMPGNPLHVLIAPAKESESTLYEDDGHTTAYRGGTYLKRLFSQRQHSQKTIIEISAPEGSYRPAARQLVLETWATCAPKSVSLESRTNGNATTELPHLRLEESKNPQSGWSFDEGLLRIKTLDDFTEMRFIIE